MFSFVILHIYYLFYLNQHKSNQVQILQLHFYILSYFNFILKLKILNLMWNNLFIAFDLLSEQNVLQLF